MPFDWQSIMSALGGRQPGALGPGGPITGSQQAGLMGQPMQNMPQMAPGSTTPQQGFGGGLLGGGGGGMGLLGAGAAMLNASGPSRMPTNFGQAFGQGLGGFAQGSMADRDMAFQQQQQNSLAQIANIMGRQGGGQGQGQGGLPRMLPGAMPGAGGSAPTLPGGQPAIPQFMAQQVMPPGGPPTGNPNVNPFLATQANMPQGNSPINPMQATSGNFPTQLPSGMQPPAGAPGTAASPDLIASSRMGIQNQFGGGLPAGGGSPFSGSFPGMSPGMGGPYAQPRQNPFMAMLMQRRGMMG